MPPRDNQKTCKKISLPDRQIKPQDIKPKLYTILPFWRQYCWVIVCLYLFAFCLHTFISLLCICDGYTVSFFFVLTQPHPPPENRCRATAFARPTCSPTLVRQLPSYNRFLQHERKNFGFNILIYVKFVVWKRNYRKSTHRPCISTSPVCVTGGCQAIVCRGDKFYSSPFSPRTVAKLGHKGNLFTEKEI